MSKACVLREKTCTVCQEHHRLRPREAEHAQLRRRLPCRAAQLHDTGELKLRGASVGLLEQRLLEHIDTGGGPEARVVVALGRLQLLRRGLRELRVVHVVVVAVRAEQRARSRGIRTLAAVVSLSWWPLQQEVDVVEHRPGRAVLQRVVWRLGGWVGGLAQRNPSPGPSPDL